MQAYTYIEEGKFALLEKAKPTLIEPTDAIVKVTLGSICTSDLHIKHGSVPRADVMTEPQTGIQLNVEAWTEGRMMLTEAQKTNLRLQVDAFLEYIG